MPPKKNGVAARPSKKRKAPGTAAVENVDMQSPMPSSPRAASRVSAASGATVPTQRLALGASLGSKRACAPRTFSERLLNGEEAAEHGAAQMLEAAALLEAAQTLELGSAPQTPLEPAPLEPAPLQLAPLQRAPFRPAPLRPAPFAAPASKRARMTQPVGAAVSAAQALAGAADQADTRPSALEEVPLKAPTRQDTAGLKMRGRVQKRAISEEERSRLLPFTEEEARGRVSAPDHASLEGVCEDFEWDSGAAW